MSSLIKILQVVTELFHGGRRTDTHNELIAACRNFANVLKTLQFRYYFLCLHFWFNAAVSQNKERKIGPMCREHRDWIFKGRSVNVEEINFYDLNWCVPFGIPSFSSLKTINWRVPSWFLFANYCSHERRLCIQTWMMSWFYRHRFYCVSVGHFLLFTVTTTGPVPSAESTPGQALLTVLYSWLLLYLILSFIISTRLVTA
jgi:hypothetical protein